MAKERIVLETSRRRKTALLTTAELRGESVADWFDEQIGLHFPEASRARLEGLSSPADASYLSEPASVVCELQAQDWSFTDDDTGYLTHDIHPYPAKFIPQIPANLISRLSVPGDVVMDPFGGSATTAVEAVRMKRRALSIDANPLSELIGRVKTGHATADTQSQISGLHALVESNILGSAHRNSLWAKSLLDKHLEFVPAIPNLDRWFSNSVLAELALIRRLILENTQFFARDAALVALSKIVVRVSNQESETRYVTTEKDLQVGDTLRAYSEALKGIARRLDASAFELAYADARFVTGDARTDLVKFAGENSVDLIVTSPPYPNAMDYHLYHRFRLFWLGFDPRALASIEIGSHLRHQRNATGFEEYQTDMQKVLEGCYRALQPGRYAVFVLGDAIFKGSLFRTTQAISKVASKVGFSVLGEIDRSIHKTRRSFSAVARRAKSEQLLVVQKPNSSVQVYLDLPKYRMWGYERRLRLLEINALTNAKIPNRRLDARTAKNIVQPSLWNLRRLTFTRGYRVGGPNCARQLTWQSVLENGDADPSRRKDPKYATHGIHPFKGKFYPQLAKALLNISGIPLGGKVLDPYCGSGTVLLEGMLNGFSACGCDLNPLAVKIARAKTQILSIDRRVAEKAIRSLLDRINRPPNTLSKLYDQFSEETLVEMRKWFAPTVITKLNWLLTQIRLLGEPTLIDFLEVIASSIVREISQQDPADLRIRRRKVPLIDAPVLKLFADRLARQQGRLLKYWAVAGRQPGSLFSPSVIEGDSRARSTFETLSLSEGTVDCVLTSPPYATALPYIDTDRLSLLTILGMDAVSRGRVEDDLTGSRELRKSEKLKLEARLEAQEATDHLPSSVVKDIRAIYRANKSGKVGFRRDNMGALLWRYFSDIRASLEHIHLLLKTYGKAFYVVGDSRTMAGSSWVNIGTCNHISQIAAKIGFFVHPAIEIDVTTENFKHIRNAITKNKILTFEKI